MAWQIFLLSKWCTHLPGCYGFFLGCCSAVAMASGGCQCVLCGFQGFVRHLLCFFFFGGELSSCYCVVR